MTALDPMPAVRDILGMPPAPKPALPTEPGLYAVYGGHSTWAASVFALDESGFWWRLGHTDITADEVAAFAGTHPLERLIRRSDGDL